MSSNARYILSAISVVLSATALVLCTLRIRKRANDSIHTDLEVKELKAERDSLQRENRILRAENNYLKGIHGQGQQKELAKPSNDFGNYTGVIF